MKLSRKSEATFVDSDPGTSAMLVCGIGSFGCWTLDIFAAILKSEFGEFPDNVQMLGIETDVRYSPKNPEVEILTFDAFPSIALRNASLPKLLDPRTPYKIPASVAAGGGGHIAQVGYHGFYRNVGRIRRTLRRKVQAGPAANLNVCVVGSACGGTASGLFVPIGALLTDLVASKESYPQAIVAIPGVGYGGGRTEHRHMANAVGLLYTLEHFSVEDFEDTYSDNTKISTEIKLGKKPYSWIQLLSPVNCAGQHVRQSSTSVTYPVRQSSNSDNDDNDDIIYLQKRAADELFAKYLVGLDAEIRSIIVNWSATQSQVPERVDYEPTEEGIAPAKGGVRIFEASGLEMVHIPRHRTCLLACQSAMKTGYNQKLCRAEAEKIRTEIFGLIQKELPEEPGTAKTDDASENTTQTLTPIDTLKKDIDTLKKDIDTLKTFMSRLNTLPGVDSGNQDLKNLKTAVKEAIDRALQNTNDLEKYGVLTELLTFQSERMPQDIRVELSDLENRLSDLENRLSDLENRLSHLKVDLQTAKTKVEKRAPVTKLWYFLRSVAVKDADKSEIEKFEEKIKKQEHNINAVADELKTTWEATETFLKEAEFSRLVADTISKDHDKALRTCNEKISTSGGEWDMDVLETRYPMSDMEKQATATVSENLMEKIQEAGISNETDLSERMEELLEIAYGEFDKIFDKTDVDETEPSPRSAKVTKHEDPSDPQPSVEFVDTYPGGTYSTGERFRVEGNDEMMFRWNYGHIRGRYTLETMFLKSHLSIWKRAKEHHDKHLLDWFKDEPGSTPIYAHKDWSQEIFVLGNEQDIQKKWNDVQEHVEVLTDTDRVRRLERLYTDIQPSDDCPWIYKRKEIQIPAWLAEFFSKKVNLSVDAKQRLVWKYEGNPYNLSTKQEREDLLEAHPTAYQALLKTSEALKQYIKWSENHEAVTKFLEES